MNDNLGHSPICCRGSRERVGHGFSRAAMGCNRFRLSPLRARPLHHHEKCSRLFAGLSLRRANIPTQAKTALEWATRRLGTDDTKTRNSGRKTPRSEEHTSELQ